MVLPSSMRKTNIPTTGNLYANATTFETFVLNG